MKTRGSGRVAISLKNVDTESQEFAPRSCDVRLGEKTFSTPTRALSSQEANAYFATSVTIDPTPHDIYEHVKTYDAAELKAIIKKDGKLREEVVAIQRMKGKHSDKVSIFFPIRAKPEISLGRAEAEGLV